MNKVISIHLRGVAFQLEENGYDALRAYLEKAERQLAANPDRAEIIADIEQAIADRFHALLSSGRNVILGSEVDVIIRDMGPVTDGAGSNPEPNATSKPGAADGEDDAAREPAGPRRLYRLKDGAMLGGVCNGLAAYLGIDVTLVRLIVALLVFVSFGSVAIAYLVAVLIIPCARTPGEKAAAAGPAPTAQEFIRKAKAGYYESVKAFPDKETRREWKRNFKREMRDWKRNLRNEFRGMFPGNPGPVTVAPPAGFHVIMPLLAFLKAILFFGAAVAVIWLVATKTLFGVALPGHLPTWAAIVLIVLGYKLLTAPLKAIHRSYHYQVHGWPVYWHPMIEMWGAVIGTFVLVFAVFVADRMVPGFHHVLVDFRDFLGHAVDALRQWWSQKAAA